MKQRSPFNPLLPKKISDQIYWGNLLGSTASLVLTETLRQQKNLLVVVTPDVASAAQIEHELKFYSSDNPNLAILNFPDWETLPYDSFSPHQDIISERILSLYKLPLTQTGILLLPITTLMQRLAPKHYIQGNSLVIAKGETFNIESMRMQLEKSGYRNVGQVIEHGEYAVRGSIIDLFPMGSDTPYRIDLFDDEIDTIRSFDPDTQRSITTFEQVELLPAREFPVTKESIELFRQQWRETFGGNPLNSSIYQDVSQGFCPAGIEYYLPLFFTNTATLFDYLPENTTIVHYGDIYGAAQHHWRDIKERYEQRSFDITRPLLAPNRLYLPVDELFQMCNNLSQIKITQETINEKVNQVNYAIAPNATFIIDNKNEKPLKNLEEFVLTTPARVLIAAETAGRREILTDLFKNSTLKPKPAKNWEDFLAGQEKLAITVGQLERGIVIIEPNIVVIAESQLFGQQIIQRRRRISKAIDQDAIVKNLAELNIGSAVVHIEHGVGRYLGLQTLTVGDYEAEYLTLEYAGGDRLYVPVSSLHVISRYSGMDIENAPLHKLGNDQWSKAKRKAAEALRDVAAELLDIYAKRAAHKGHALAVPDSDYQAFAATFPFETTPDQQQAIDNVLTDMSTDKIMDRLVCGDVGFGKTEVAMRAAFLAVNNNKQVALLVPTTLLAMQHYQNFKDRFADWPVRIEVISRFRSQKEQKQIIEQLNQGKIDIIIGTHKLLQEDIKFQRLGLLIIDEEHRFGVKQKEQLKKWRTEVDMLTLTATPIPRTLNMALSGVRELSIIATPPSRRLAIKTFVHAYDKQLIREAILRELLRGGQIYFLHNEVETIHKQAEELAELIPEARIDIAHGQMRERELEQVMANFYHQRFHVLVCTTIVESGIDVPSANTIIINRADKLGLAQLHQIRGRVGRSHHQAYAYLLTPPQKKLTPDAEKRLDAIASLEDLGVGFTLATHDLEIRGAGELLGEEQSGNIQAIGFSLYMELLEKTVTALKEGKEPSLELSLHSDTEIDLQIPALFPQDFIPDVHTRLSLYKRVTNTNTAEELEELQVEVIDRFGLFPQPVKNLFQIAELRQLAKKMGIQKIEANAQGGRIDFHKDPNIDSMKLITLIQKQSQLYKLQGQQRLQFKFPERIEDAVTRIARVYAILEQIKR